MNADKALELARLAYPNDENLRVAYMLGLNAGAEWQAEQDEKEQADLFTIVALDAAQRAKEQMMKMAVEGKVTERTVSGSRPETYAITTKHFYSSTLKLGDKVKVIIIKDDESD